MLSRSAIRAAAIADKDYRGYYRPMPAVLEACVGGGGQALGLEAAGFECASAIEIDPAACKTLRANRPDWRVIQADIKNVSGREFRGVDLFAAGIPCPPFSIAGKQLGFLDERDLFPDALRVIGSFNRTPRRTRSMA